MKTRNVESDGCSLELDRFGEVAVNSPVYEAIFQLRRASNASREKTQHDTQSSVRLLLTTELVQLWNQHSFFVKPYSARVLSVHQTWTVSRMQHCTTLLLNFQMESTCTTVRPQFMVS